ncbi:FUSC family protein [Pokkaliibacter sp. CJK22405]|uniref:FUSC family protein n=1 Tax=Pokkaliibacter sp. CJK22405 TaxID=3384615 RepID=UPI0039850819
MKIRGFQVVFALRLFIAAMLAFAVAVKMGLPQPYWAMVTCCVVMNPTMGALRSKAVYRICGTIGAGIITLALVSVLASVPLVLVVCTGLVAAISFGLSFIDRTPRAYGFQLGGITLMLVAVAGINSPETMFNTVVARCTEICLGVVSTVLIDSIIAPRSMAPMLHQRMQSWLPDVEKWLTDILSHQSSDTAIAHDRLKTLADIASLSQLISQFRYDPSISRFELRCALAIQHRLMRIAPLLSAIRGRLAQLSEADRELLQPTLDEITQQLHSRQQLTPEVIAALRQHPAASAEDVPWLSLVHDQLADLLGRLSRYWEEVWQLHDSMYEHRPLSGRLMKELKETRAFPLPPDLNLAVRMALSVGTAYTILSLIWYYTGWSQGPNMVLLGVIGLAFFGGGDEPGKGIAKFGRFALLALTLAGVLCYGLLPMATNFPLFVMAMACLMVPLGIWAAVNPMAILLLAVGLSSINLQGTYSPWDFGFFLDAGVANLLGIYVGFVSVSFFRSWGVVSVLEGYRQQELDDRLKLIERATLRRKEAYLYRALDRIASMTPRLVPGGQLEESFILLRRLRIGANIADLRILLRQLEGPVAAQLFGVLATLARDLKARTPSDELLQQLDQSLRDLWYSEHPQRLDILRALTGIRLGVFESASPWRLSYRRADGSTELAASA